MFVTEVEAVALGARNLTNIHARIVNWFLFGFILMIGPFFIATVSYMGAVIHKNLAWALCNMGILLLGCSTVAWFIVGIVFRYSRKGRYSAGTVLPPDTDKDDWLATIKADGTLYQYYSGQFMNNFFVVAFILLVVSIATGVLVSCYACCCVGGSSSKFGK